MPVEDLAARLDMATAVVAAVDRLGVPDEGENLCLFRAGKVLEAGKHLNADRLQLCLVDVGEPEPYQIVCGAPTRRWGRPPRSPYPARSSPEVSCSSAESSGRKPPRG